MTTAPEATAPGATPGTRDALLESRGITKRFAGITALHDVALDVRPGELVGLIGPNGAGKTTFFNCLLGMERPDSGHVVFDGRDVTDLPIYKRARLGIGRTFQRREVFVGLSVLEHFLLADRARRGEVPLWRDLLRLSRTTADEMERAGAMLDALGIRDLAEKPIEALSLGRSRLVELGRALMTQPKLLLLDEPSSGLDRKETAALAQRLRRLAEESGTAVLLVEHDIDLVQQVVTRIFVLDFGTMIASGPTDDVLSDAAVRKAYLGDTV
ncbi:MAG TPA: ABC transporter ATP-binding protein [Acidimicrobiia bacterium]|nr:ABC transporter ATP-binding protein [Acidimicrobiia bacterium]